VTTVGKDARWKSRLKQWWVIIAGSGVGALIAVAAIVQITGVSLKDVLQGLHSNQPAQQAVHSPASTSPPISTPTSTPSSTPTSTPEASSNPATGAAATGVGATGGFPIQAFEGQWTWPNHEAFGLRAGDILATAELTYYGPGPVPEGQVAEIRFTSRTGDTLNGTVETVGPGTYRFKPGDPVSVILTRDGKSLQLVIGQNNVASGTLSRV
jgi:hypothetical protein